MAITKLSNTPSNQNVLQPNKFVLNFSRLPNVQFFCQTLSLPGISAGEIMINTPFVDRYSPGEKIVYEPLSVTFLVDEDMKSWLEIHDWIRAMTFPENFDEYKRLPNLSRVSFVAPNPQFSDATLTIYSSAYTPTYRFKFFDVFPSSLSGIVFDTQQGPDNTITADVMLRYTYYNLEKL